MTDVIRNHIEIIQGAGGPKAVIAGHRVRVEDVVIWHERLRMSPDEIVDMIPTITLADVHAALAYYWDNREQLDREFEAGRLFEEDMRRQAGPSRLAERVAEIRREMAG